MNSVRLTMTCRITAAPLRQPWTLDAAAAVWAMLMALAAAGVRPCLAGDVLDGCAARVDAEQVQHELVRELPPPAALGLGSDSFPWYVPLKIHVVRYSDGSGGLSPEQVQTSLAEVAGRLQQTDVRSFQYSEIDYIDDSDYAEILRLCNGGSNDGNVCSDDDDCLDGSCLTESECAGGSNDGTPCMDDGACTGGGTCVAQTELLKVTNTQPGTLNLYYVPVLTALCGTSAFTSGAYQGVLVANDCATNISTTTHEIGHYFDLYHTHETGFGVECPDGLFCDSGGDLICDTPADAGLSGHVGPAPGCTWDQLICQSGPNQGQACFTDLDCDPSGLDACSSRSSWPPGCGSVGFDPDAKNIMSYSTKACRDKLTADQNDRWLSVWLSDRTELFDHTRYVDNNGGDGAGTPMDPDGSLADAVNDAMPGDHLFLRSVSFVEQLVITKPLHLKAWNPGGGPAVIGEP